MTKKLTKEQVIGILLLVSALLIFVPIPLINGSIIGAIIVATIGIYHLIK